MEKKLVLAQQRKDKGNVLFKAGEFSKASCEYEKVDFNFEKISLIIRACLI